jgi:hypothetical protein
MLTESRSTFLLVRNTECLARANEDLRVYQSFLRRRSPASGVETVQGIWIDEEDVANLPSALVLPDATGAQQTVRILEAAGINGLWMLCWLEAPARTVSRVDLVAALLSSFGPKDPTTLATRFIPVLVDDVPGSSVSAELQALGARYPGLVGSPIYQDAAGGLVLPSGPPQHDGAAL